VAAAKLPLGVPSRLPLSAFWIAKRLVCTPHGHSEASRAVERQAGYALLGALLSCLHGGVLQERNDDVLQMLQVCVCGGGGGRGRRWPLVLLARAVLLRSVCARRPGALGGPPLLAGLLPGSAAACGWRGQ
jgi:hypothetical protein